MPPARCSWRSSSRSRWRSSPRPAPTARTSRPARASRSASRRSTAARTSGILASTDALVRQIPGRLVGMTTDLDGQRAFVMTLRAREQDIRRDKAASNICTNQALLALAASIYLATIGPHGLRDVAALGAARAAELEAASRRRRRALHPGRTSTSSPSGSPMRGRPPPPARARRPRRPRPGRRRARRPVARRRPARVRDRGHDLGDEIARSPRRSPPAPAGGATPAPATRQRRERPDERHRPRLQPTLFERSRPGRGGGKIPHPPKDALDRIAGRRAPRDAAGAARAERARRRPPLRQPVAAQLRGRHRASTRSARAR